MRFRRARLADVGPLLEIEREAFATDLLTERKLRHLLTRGNCELVVAEEEERLAGYALVLFRRGIRTARLYGFAVAADFRRQGLGGRLLREAERRAARRGATRITLETSPANPAVRLYENAGYEFVADLGPYYEDGARAHRYAKSQGRPAAPRRRVDSSPSARRVSGQILRPRGPGPGGPGRGANTG